MRRFTPIRITKNDRQEYARLVRNTKAKIRRTIKNYGIDLSDEIEIPSIEDFKTRNEFNRWKERQASFTNRANLHYQFKKNPYGVVASKKRIADIQRDNKQAQQIADKLIESAKEKPFISGGKEQGTVEQRMLQMARPNAAGVYRPPDFDFDKIRSEYELRRKEQNLKKRADEQYYDERMERMKENFIKLLEESFNSDADELIEKIKDIPAEDFYEMYLMFDEFDFDLYYTLDVEGETHETQINQMLHYVDRYHTKKINMDLKGF